MAFDLSEITTLATLVNSDAKLQQELWSEGIKADASDMNPLKDFTGPEGSGMPIIEKTDSSKLGGQVVHFSTYAPVRGRGVMGSAELKSKTGKVRYGTFKVTVDLRRFALSEEQLVAFFSQPGNANKNRDEFLFGLCRDWWVRTQCDDKQFVLRDKALFATGQPNVYRIGGGADVDAITIADTFSTQVITDCRNQLVGMGASAMKYGQSEAGQKIPQFLVFAPQRFLDPLDSEQAFREAVHHNQDRDGGAYWWTGKLPVWKNHVLFGHDIVEDSGPNRQGSPLMPIARLGQALDDNDTVLHGGGAWNTDGSLTDTTLYDFMAYFRGFYWKTYENETAPTDNNTYYLMIYNVSGADKGKYEIVSYAAAANNGNRITAITRELDEANYTQKTQLTAAGRYSNVHPSGSLVIPCNRRGVPIGYGLVLGAEGLFQGKGALEADPIEWADDFQSKTSGRAHINAQGIQSITGYSPAEDTLGRYPNYLLIEGALDMPELDLVELEVA